MRRALAASLTIIGLVFALLGSAPGAYAQGSSAGEAITGYLATSGCPGTRAPPCFIQWSPTNPLAVTGTFSASLGGFRPTAFGTAVSASSVSSTQSLPAGAQVVATNTSATVGAYCALGATATTSSQFIPPNSWFGFAISGDTQISCITASSTATINTAGGSGLPTGANGGSTTGTASNAADGVATSTNNLSDVSYPFLWNGATFDRWKGDTTNGAFVNVKTSVLPTGAASATNQTTANASLASIDTKTLTLVADPCQAVAKTSVAISQATNTKLFSQTSAKKNYICSIMIVAADAENLSLVEGTGSVCGTSTAAIIGATTAAAGPNLAANGGFSMGSGVASIAAGANNNFDVCLFQSGSGRVAGVLTYVQQ